MRSVHIILLAIILVLFTLNNNSLNAQDKGALGAGIILGDPTGPNVKYWFNPNTAIDFGLGFEKDFTVYSDILWHEWSLFPQPAKGRLVGYFGLGLQYEEKKG